MKVPALNVWLGDSNKTLTYSLDYNIFWGKIKKIKKKKLILKNHPRDYYEVSKEEKWLFMLLKWKKKNLINCFLSICNLFLQELSANSQLEIDGSIKIYLSINYHENFHII